MNFQYKRCIEAKQGSGSNDNMDIARHFDSHVRQEVCFRIYNTELDSI